ncbi:hypothetical protein SKPI104516_01830 [Skermania piniformis]
MLRIALVRLSPCAAAPLTSHFVEANSLSRWTYSVSDFVETGIELINPWDLETP